MATPEEIAKAEKDQEEAAAAAAETQTEETEENTPGTKEEPAKTSVADDGKLAEVLERLAERLTPQMTAEERETALKKMEEETGFSRKQLTTLNKIKQDAVLQASLTHGEATGKTRAEQILGKYAPKLSTEVVEAMSKLAPEVRSNPKAWEEMAYLIKGKRADHVKIDEETHEETHTENGTKVGGGMKGLTTVKKGSTSGKGGAGKQYDADEQRMINQYFGGDAAAYEATKAEKTVGLPRKSESQATTGAADRELMRLTGGQVG